MVAFAKNKKDDLALLKKLEVTNVRARPGRTTTTNSPGFYTW